MRIKKNYGNKSYDFSKNTVQYEDLTHTKKNYYQNNITASII